jgi:DUF971 family protein
MRRQPPVARDSKACSFKTSVLRQVLDVTDFEMASIKLHYCLEALAFRVDVVLFNDGEDSGVHTWALCEDLGTEDSTQVVHSLLELPSVRISNTLKGWLEYGALLG